MKAKTSLRILFVTNEIPFPPNNGVKIVSYNALRLMSEAGHELALAVLTEETEDNENRIRNLASFCKNGMAVWMPLPKRNRFAVQLSAVLSNKLFFIERYKCPQFKQMLVEMIDKFMPDVIHFDLIPMTQYWDVAPSGVGTVASINDSYSLTMENFLGVGNYYTGLERLYRRVQYSQICRYESKVYSRFDVTHVMSEADENYLHKLNPGISTAVIPNGVEQSLFNIAILTMEKVDVVFVAKLDVDNLHALEQFILHGWPIVHREYPDVALRIIGKISSQAQRLRTQLKYPEGIFFLGYVESLTDAYCNSGIALVPNNKNCGIMNKAIEAMAAGLVVVGFKNAFTGITHAKEGEHYLSAQDYSEMGQLVVDIIRDEPRRKSIQLNAHQMASKYYTWHNRSSAYEKMYQTASENKKN